MVDLTTLIITSAICLAIGIFLGLLFSSLRSGKVERTPQRPAWDPGQDEKIESGRASRDFAAPAPSITGRHTPAPLNPAPIAGHPSLSPVKAQGRAIQSAPGSRANPQMSIAVQVDEILQEKLENLPPGQLTPEQRATRLVELPGRGLVVMVGLNQFEGVDSVPDVSIRKLISEAVEEWEQRAIPGDPS